MSTNPYAPDAFYTPPTDRDASRMPPPPPSSWPTVVGVISIVWGSLSVLGGCCMVGIFSTLTAMGPLLEDEMTQEELDDFQQLATLQGPLIALGVVQLMLAIYLIAGGISLSKHRPFGPRHLKMWAVLHLVYSIGSTVFMMTFDLSPDPETAPDPELARIEQISSTAGMICGLIVGLAWPVFTLIWFGREKIKAEVAQWDTALR